MSAAGGEGIALGPLAERLGGRLLGDAEARVVRVAALDEAGPSDLSIVQHPKERRRVREIRAGCLLADEGFAAEHAHELEGAVIALENPYLALAEAIRILHPPPPPPVGVDPRAVVHPEAELGEGCFVGPLAVVGRARLGPRVRVGPQAFIDDDVNIGEESEIGPGAVIRHGARLGARVVVGPGAIIGWDGFGYAPEDSRNVKVPQIGGVILEDDVEVGANACIDRGALSDTRVGRGTKIDNQVQVAHGVVIGEDAVLVGQVGIAGGVRIGHRVVFAGQAGCAPFVIVGDDARVGGRAGVTRDVPPRTAVSGMPAIPHADWLKAQIHLTRLEDMARRLVRAEARIFELEARLVARDEEDADGG